MPNLESVELHTVVQWDPEQLTTEIGGEVVAMCARKGVYVGLDATASLIWKRLETPRTVGDLCRELSGAFEGDAVTIERDVVELLNDLRGLGMVQAAGLP